jgi:hypothetical protein
LARNPMVLTAANRPSCGRFVGNAEVKPSPVRKPFA